MTKRKIEIFSAGCTVCDEAVEAIRAAACSSCEIEVRPMTEAAAAKDASRYGIKSLPAVVIDGQLAGCCTGRGIDLAELRRLGLGQPLSY